VRGGRAVTPPPTDVLDSLRQKIARIERPSLGPAAEARSRREVPWRLGCSAADALLPDGLETSSLHEIKPALRGQGASAGDWTASLGFALRLAALRLEAAQRADRPAFLLWCWPRPMAFELGRLSGRGMMHLGLDPARVLIVETAREAEALMALEEGMKSGALALAMGVFQSASLNAARRLSLAAGECRTPCLIMTHPAREAAAGCATRWRIARAPSAPHPFDARAPGLPRFSASLERCRARPQSAGLPPLQLEWCDETLRFRMAAQLASDAPGARRARHSA
jgi:protein ImuA